MLAFAWGILAAMLAAREPPRAEARPRPAAYCHTNQSGVGLLCRDVEKFQDI